MAIKVGARIPSGITLRYLAPEGVKAVSSDEFFKGKKVAVFGLPGAYTRTCSSRHLPGYVQNSDALKQKGIDQIACVSVNDAFVMGAWGAARGGAGMGTLSRLYSMMGDDGVVKELNVEPSGKSGPPSAETMLQR